MFAGVRLLTGVAGALLLVACGAGGGRPVTTPAQLRALAVNGPAQLREADRQLTETEAEFAALSRSHGGRWRERGYFDARESDRIEHLMLRHVTAQDALAGLAGPLAGGGGAGGDAETAVAAQLVGVDAQFLLIAHRGRLVSMFDDDPVAVAKLNEAFFRSGIPRGGFDACRRSLESGDTARRLAAAESWIESLRGDERVRALTSANPSYARLVARIPEDHRAAREATSGHRPVERLEASAAGDLARRMERALGDAGYRTRALVFKDVSRLKDPRARVIGFSAAQHAEVRRRLEPGDLVLTYTAGYLSDVFIPGQFKHGITYVGTPAQRRAAGMRRGLETGKLVDGRRADVIEAVAEGVIFNDLAYLMDTHVNRMLVLRPRYGAADRAGYLDGVASYLGDAYDFRFDFADASRQVCTEVIYRAMNGRAGIDFPLTRRGGHPTLSADDLVTFHLASSGRHFEVILLAEEDPSRPGHRALLRSGADAETRLRELMSGG